MGSFGPTDRYASRLFEADRHFKPVSELTWQWANTRLAIGAHMDAISRI